MSERENILGRIREALSLAAPKPGHEPGAPGRATDRLPQSTLMREWLPPAGESFAQRLELFTRNAAALKAEFHLVNDLDELSTRLGALRDNEHWTKVGTHQGELTDLVCSKLNLPVCRTDNRYPVAELESCSAGLTQCDALVAQTGSVLVTSRSAGGRALSVLPPHHVVLAHRRQLVRDLPEAFELLKTSYAPNYPSFVSFITGPSRTGDIERILVLGAHGPKKLTIFMV